jgi:hypothetical protein
MIWWFYWHCFGKEFQGPKIVPLALAIAFPASCSKWLNFQPLNAEEPDKISAVKVERPAKSLKFLDSLFQFLHRNTNTVITNDLPKCEKVWGQKSTRNCLTNVCQKRYQYCYNQWFTKMWKSMRSEINKKLFNKCVPKKIPILLLPMIYQNVKKYEVRNQQEIV